MGGGRGWNLGFSKLDFPGFTPAKRKKRSVDDLGINRPKTNLIRISVKTETIERQFK